MLTHSMVTLPWPVHLARRQSSSKAREPSMKAHRKKSILDRLLSDWWVDLGVAAFVLVMLTVSALR